MTRHSTSVGRLLIAFVFVLGVTMPTVAEARTSGRSGGQKTVHVKEYKKKDGTTVQTHERTPSGKKGDATAKPTAAAKPKTESVAKAPTSKASAATAAAPREAKGRIQRSEAAKHAYEAQTGYRHGRPGYVVDHIKPLACGGTDTPGNMQWQTIEAAKAKDKVERLGCR